MARVAIDSSAQNNEQAVVILGGGYDSVHDTPQFPLQPDGSGSSVLMLDLFTGEELWRASSDSNANLRLPQMTRSIPSGITVTDINGDGFADRMYAADLGGQIWRFDIWAGRTSDSLVTGGVIARFGAEGTADNGDSARRFYNSPDVALFTDTTQNKQYLSVSVGSGYRAHPLNNDAADRFYSLRDPDIFNALTQAEYDGYDIARDADMVEVSGRVNVALSPDDRGWKLTLPPTQKVLTDSVTFDNSVFFTGFSPDIRAAADCRASVGRNFLYRMNIVNGDPVVNNRDLLTAETADAARSTDLAQGGIAPSPTFLFPSSGDENCEGESCLQPPLGCVGVECFDPGFVNRPVRTLWTQDGIQ
jgi:type IV pilus assembly protein PilY1